MNELKAFNDLLYKRPDFEGMKEFYKKLNEKVKAANKHACWEDYMTLCKLGGSLGYLDTIRAANLAVPFEKGGVKRAVSYAIEILNKQIEE